MQLFNTIVNGQRTTLSLVEQEGRCFNLLVLRSGTSDRATSLVFEFDNVTFSSLVSGIQFIKDDTIKQIKYMNSRYRGETEAIQQLEDQLIFCNNLLDNV